MDEIIKVSSITQAHEMLQIEAPRHPLITVWEDSQFLQENRENFKQYEGLKIAFDMYSIMFKSNRSGSMGYGRTSYDFQHGTLIFIAPGQPVSVPTHEEEDPDGWSLSFHPDLIRKTPLGQSIDRYSFFEYESNEALHLSQEEQEHIFHVVKQIRKEYSQNLDQHSSRLIVSNLELLLDYCLRFYDRQFYTRSSVSSDLVTDFERLLKSYFNNEKPVELGIPTVSYFGEALNMSPSYLSDLLKKETGTSAKGHINDMLVNKAKSALLGTNLSVSEIAYDLGFEHPQSFTRLFKSKAGVSPKEYRHLN